MKIYQIELRRVSYDNVTLEAESVEHAKAQAKEYINQTYYREDGEWEIVTVELEDAVQKG